MSRRPLVPRHGTISLLIAMSLACVAGAQTLTLQAAAGKDGRSVSVTAPAPARKKSTIKLPVKLNAAGKHGEVWLEVSATDRTKPAQKLTLRLPLSSTEDVYGESRACTVNPNGTVQLSFTAGMDEHNFVDFAPAEKATEIKLSLNKYLCRAMAAPFQCNGQPVTLHPDWNQWQLGSTDTLVLTSDAPATLTTARPVIEASDKPFDPASCAVIAPSNGMCCVAHKTTQWHCGGTPAGPGWHQVSGDCFHRETGTSCVDGERLEMPSLTPPLLP